MWCSGEPPSRVLITNSCQRTLRPAVHFSDRRQRATSVICRDDSATVVFGVVACAHVTEYGETITLFAVMCVVHVHRS